MNSFTPRRFRPNRQHRPDRLPVALWRDHVTGLHAVLRDAARDNLHAVLAGAAPVALAAGLELGDTGEDPLTGYALADWRAGKLPDPAFAMQLMQEPDRAAAIAQPRSGLGSALLLPRLLEAVLGDGAFRHDLAENCRRFLCERVLFHPGPPPQALFSAAALAQLCLSQPGHLGRLPGRSRAALQAAAVCLLAQGGEPAPWDQWLYRRMDAAADWRLADGLAALPWVAWRRGDPMPDLADGAQLPGCWLPLLDLDP